MIMKGGTITVLCFIALLMATADGAASIDPATALATKPDADTSCSTNVFNIYPCILYLEVGANLTKPTNNCCLGFKTLLSINASCICSALTHAKDFGYSINTSRVATLPQLCGIDHLPPVVSQCPIPGAPAPMPSAPMPSAPQPSTPATPPSNPPTATPPSPSPPSTTPPPSPHSTPTPPTPSPSPKSSPPPTITPSTPPPTTPSAPPPTTPSAPAPTTPSAPAPSSNSSTEVPAPSPNRSSTRSRTFFTPLGLVSAVMAVSPFLVV